MFAASPRHFILASKHQIVRGICPAVLRVSSLDIGSFTRQNAFSNSGLSLHAFSVRYFSEESRNLMGRILANYPATEPFRTKTQIISDLKAKKLSVEKVVTQICV